MAPSKSPILTHSHSKHSSLKKSKTLLDQTLKDKLSVKFLKKSLTNKDIASLNQSEKNSNTLMIEPTSLKKKKTIKTAKLLKGYIITATTTMVPSNQSFGKSILISSSFNDRALSGTGVLNIPTNGVLTRNEQETLQKQHTFQPIDDPISGSNSQQKPSPKKLNIEKFKTITAGPYSKIGKQSTDRNERNIRNLIQQAPYR